MATTRKATRLKEPVKVRTKKLADGSESYYLDIYVDGRRSYEFLKLYLLPEINPMIKEQNRAIKAAVEAIKSKRIIELTHSKAGLKKTSVRSKMLLDDWMDAHLYNSVVVALMLIVYGVAFILIERRPRVPTTTKLSRITYPQAFKVGCWQVLSLIPGTSRSGSTILGGMLCGMSRPAASQFTFFLAIPVMAGASLLKLVKFFGKGNSFTLDQTVVLIVGCAVAFIVSIIAIRFLMDYVKRHNFTFFGIYRIALGLVVLAVAVVSAMV